MTVSFDNPTYPLDQVHPAIKYGDIRMTTACESDAAEIGYDQEDVEQAILNLTPEDFYKTMPSNCGDGTQQDVYHYYDGEQTVYIKFLFIRDVLVLSFKER